VKVAFVVNDLQLSGGIGVVVEHAGQLARRHGFDVTLVLAREQEVPGWRYRGLSDVAVLGLPAARDVRFDVALATWWETTYALFELGADRYGYFLQSLEDRFYRPEAPARLAAALTHDLPVALITEARWIAETLEAMRPGTHVHYVRNGIAKDVFSGPDEPVVLTSGPLRILVEGSLHEGFKGVSEALLAAAAMQEPHHVTLVTPDGSRPQPGAHADRAVGPVSPTDMAALYAQSHVVLKLSRVEGMYGPPLEGFHMGATTVTTAVTGHEEYVRHGWNGLVVEWDDIRGTARALDLLARDRALLHFLRYNALRTAAAWPSWEQQGMVMAAALRAIRRAPAPRAADSARALLADVRAGVQAHAEVVADRGRLRYRIAPLLALERGMELRPVRGVTRPLRRAWGAARRRLGR
jgi:glycosyltransferase involved in cell wall biosynthesis